MMDIFNFILVAVLIALIFVMIWNPWYEADPDTGNAGNMQVLASIIVIWFIILIIFLKRELD